MNNHKLVLSILLSLLTIISVQITSHANTAPVFTDGEKTSRNVRENTAADENIGDPVSATDDDDDTLTYSLGGTNASSFAIDSSTGQLKTSAELNYESKTTYKVTITVSDGNEGSDTINVTIRVRDVVDVYTPLSDRTPAVTQEIVRRISSARTADDVGDSDLTEISQLFLFNKGITSLKDGDFSGLSDMSILWLSNNSLTTLPENVFKGCSSLRTLFLSNNSITSLPVGVFKGLSSLRQLEMSLNHDLRSLPDGIFAGLESLYILELTTGSVRFSLHVSFREVSTGIYKATANLGAPFDMTLPLSVTNGSILGGATSITIPIGKTESEDTIHVVRTPGTTAAVILNFGASLPSIPADMMVTASSKRMIYRWKSIIIVARYSQIVAPRYLSLKTPLPIETSVVLCLQQLPLIIH